MSEPSLVNEQVDVSVRPTGTEDQFLVEVTTGYKVSGVTTAEEAVREVFR